MRFFILFAAIILGASSLQAKENICELTVGVVPQFEQRKLIKIWQPILEKLGNKTGCDFILKGTQTISEFEQRFVTGEYDIAYMNPYHAVMANNAQGYIPIARSGAKKLKGILTVHKDSGITHVQQLDGATISFPSPNALGASLLMRAELKQKHDISITPLYVKTHSSVYLHTAKKLTAAGGGVMRTLKEQKPSLQNMLNIIYTTPPVPAHPLVVHPRIDIAMRNQIQDSWLALAAEDLGIFDHIPMKQPIATSMDDYLPLKNMGLEKFVGGEK